MTRGEADTRIQQRWVIALVSAAVMLYEIGITRVLSVSLWYHFAFLAVSLAMLGLGVPGVWYALRGVGPRSVERSLLIAAVAAPLSLIVFLAYGGPLATRTALAAVCIIVPLLAMGAAVCALLVAAPGRELNRLYGADLLGATVGALCVVPLMNVIPTPLLVAASGALPALALFLLGHRRSSLALLAALAVVLVWGQPLRLRYTKNYADAQFGMIHERWTPTARLTVFSRPFWVEQPDAAFGWGFGTGYAPRPFEQLWLEQDGSAGTPITKLDRGPQALEHLSWDVTSLGYQTAAPRRVCVIGAGGGRDVLTALHHGAAEVDAVELNPGIVDLVSREFGSYSGDVYHLPGVRPIVSEGRSFLAGTDQRYDLIQISLIDSWAATSAGAYALSENYLYTVEAYRLYWRRLAEHGTLATSRWVLGERMLETLRLAHLAVEAMRREGVERPWDHVAVVQAERVATILASRDPFTGARLDTLEAVCARRGFLRHWPPPVAFDPQNPTLGPYLEQGPQAFAAWGVDLSPPVDDKPFFFHTIGILARHDPAALSQLSVNEVAVSLLRKLTAIVGAAAALLFFSPFALRRSVPRGPGFWRGSLYFACIGIGFMLVEIPILQRLILYLGHPSHATSVVLASILLGAGLGAFASTRLTPDRIPWWGAALVGGLIAADLALVHGFELALRWAWPVRALASAALVGLVGFLMGFALPLGMDRFGERSRAWFWAINGTSGVFASIASLALAMAFGFSRVHAMGAACYALAVFLLWTGPRPSPAPVRA